MTASKAKDLFRQITEEYFGGKSTVIFANQSRQPKPEIPLVTLMPGNAKRPLAANNSVVNDALISHFQTRLPITVDLFTNGKPVYDDENGVEVGSENTAVDEMISYMDFLSSEYVIAWCNRNDVAIGFEGDVQDVTGLINETTYEFRSRLVALIYYTHKTTGTKSATVD